MQSSGITIMRFRVVLSDDFADAVGVRSFWYSIPSPPRKFSQLLKEFLKKLRIRKNFYGENLKIYLTPAQSSQEERAMVLHESSTELIKDGDIIELCLCSQADRYQNHAKTPVPTTENLILRNDKHSFSLEAIRSKCTNNSQSRSARRKSAMRKRNREEQTKSLESQQRGVKTKLEKKREAKQGEWSEADEFKIADSLDHGSFLRAPSHGDRKSEIVSLAKNGRSEPRIFAAAKFSQVGPPRPADLSNRINNESLMDVTSLLQMAKEKEEQLKMSTIDSSVNKIQDDSLGTLSGPLNHCHGTFGNNKKRRKALRNGAMGPILEMLRETQTEK